MDPRSRAPYPRLCRRPGGRLPDRGGSLAGTPRPESLHRARPAVAAVGLGRRPPDGPERLPSDRPAPCGTGRLGFARCSLASPGPAPGHSLRACPAPSRAGGSPRATPRSRRRLTVAGSGAAFAAGKMRLTDVCNRLPSRAPCGSLDSRLRPGSRRALRRVAPRAPTHPGREPRPARLGSLPSAYRMSRPGGASLDGEPPASALPQPSREPPEEPDRNRGPGRPRVRPSAVLAEPRSTAPPR
jgi:hypothetical protein